MSPLLVRLWFGQSERLLPQRSPWQRTLRAVEVLPTVVLGHDVVDRVEVVQLEPGQ